MRFIKAGIAWFHTSIAWSNSRASWHERLVLALFVAIAVGLGVLSTRIGFWPALALWAVYVAVITVGSRQGWLQLFGPVLFYDMIRTARQSRHAVMRLLYAGLLLGILCVIYLEIAWSWQREQFFASVCVFGIFIVALGGLIALFGVVESPEGRKRLATLIVLVVGVFVLCVTLVYVLADQEVLHIDGQRANHRSAAVLAESYFGVFMLVQLGLVALLTPAYVGGAIADEKDKKTLEFMLATDLNNHEIVLSKLLSRLANITLFLLTGLPILSILQFLGGVDADLMLMGFAGTGLTMLGIGSVSILFSTLYQRPRDAIGISYLAIVAYVGLATLGKGLSLASPWPMTYPVRFDDYTLTLNEVAWFVNLGNPIAAVIDISLAMRSATLLTTLPGLLTGYAWFHGILSAVCIVWSIARVRAIALKQTTAGTTKKLARANRPDIGAEPMIWKEIYIESGIKLNWVAWIAVGILVLGTVGSGLSIIAGFAWEWLVEGHGNRWNEIGRGMNEWFRVAGTSVACLMLLRVAVHASTTITSERERETFDALLTTPLSSEAMLGAKLLGCLTSMRMGWIWLGSMVVLALLTRGLHPLAVPILVVAVLIYSTFFSMIGLWFSMVCKSSMRATVSTVLASLFLGGGHWLVVSLCCYFPSSFMLRGSSPIELRHILFFHASMTPPFVMGFLSYSWDDLARDFGHREEGEIMAYCFVGLFLWAGACWFLWYGLLLPKFREITRREAPLASRERKRPEF
jgi:ABC-type transport system involved in multi-copper enzyme maturation permease subunit